LINDKLCPSNIPATLPKEKFASKSVFLELSVEVIRVINNLDSPKAEENVTPHAPADWGRGEVMEVVAAGCIL